MKADRAFWRGAFVLLVANGLGGALNYGFQVQAARKVSLIEYGILNSWIADITVMMSIGVLCQMLGVYFPFNRRQLRWTGTGILVLAIVLSIFLIILERQGLLIGTLGTLAVVAIGIPSSWLAGQLQGRLRFGSLGLAGVLSATAKLGIASADLASQGGVQNFYLAITLSGAISGGSLGIAALLTAATDSTNPPIIDGALKRISSALLLALASALVPQLDLINLRQTQTASVIGQYSRVALFAKAIFFGASTALQVTLPLHLRGKSVNTGDKQAQVILRTEILLLAVCGLGAIVAAWVGPWLSMHYLGFDLALYRSWILLTGLIASVLFGLLQDFQRSCAGLNWQRAALGIGGLLGLLGLNLIVRPDSVELYLTLALCYYTMLLAVLLATSRKIRRFKKTA